MQSGLYRDFSPKKRPLRKLCIQTRVEDGQVIYLFYKKDVANPLLLRASSAMPLKMKRTALIQEALRRLLRTKRELDWKIRADILSEFSQTS